jgi:hypothetical protein
VEYYDAATYEAVAEARSRAPSGQHIRVERRESTHLLEIVFEY